MLGLGLGLNKNKKGYTGLFDDLGIVNNCVLAFSPYKRITKEYTGYLINCQRSSDSAIQTFGYDDNGDISSSDIVTFSQGGDVDIIDIPLQIGTGLAYQATDTKRPKIVVGGVFKSDGPCFDGTDDVMIIDDYAGLQRTNPNICIFSNYKPMVSSTNRYIFTRNQQYTSDIQYALIQQTTTIQTYLEGASRTSQTHNISSVNKYMTDWQDLNANGLKTIINNNTASYTFTAVLTNRIKTAIGARTSAAGFNYYFNGCVKNIFVFNSSQYSNYNNLSSL